MKLPQIIQHKVYDLPGLLHQIRRWRLLNKTVSFTNGVFDILHRGHIASLSEDAIEADFLIVGVDSDASVKRLKGDRRPVNDEQARSTLLASLLMVDAVIIFEEDTPLELISVILPDVLVKGGDYTLERIVGAKEVMAAGGRVVINPIVPGYSTTNIIHRLDSL
jgi:D-beta-D-heptose 7-phosphate kinase/D-beta-D-heptose 1-phosphate adenosyltransferase